MQPEDGTGPRGRGMTALKNSRLGFSKKYGVFLPGAWFTLSPAPSGARVPTHIKWVGIASWIWFSPGQSRWLIWVHREPTGFGMQISKLSSPTPPNFPFPRHPWVQSPMTFCGALQVCVLLSFKAFSHAVRSAWITLFCIFFL